MGEGEGSVSGYWRGAVSCGCEAGGDCCARYGSNWGQGKGYGYRGRSSGKGVAAKRQSYKHLIMDIKTLDSERNTRPDTRPQYNRRLREGTLTLRDLAHSH